MSNDNLDSSDNSHNKINKIEYDYEDKLKKIYFPYKKGVNYADILVTTEGSYSISSNKGSNKLVYLLEKYFKTTKITITDGTANNGSDTIAMGLKFKHINSIELDKVNFEVLKNNVKIYNLNNVKIYNGNTIKIIPELTQDVIYIDAPWGGQNYKNNQKMELYLDNLQLGEVYNKFKKNTKLFVFKIPKNYDFTNFIQITQVEKYYIHAYISNNNIIKYFLLFVPC
jgi:16S rRNA G966 N2-methylase RsmD